MNEIKQSPHLIESSFTKTIRNEQQIQKNRNQLQNGRTTKLYYQRFVQIQSSLNTVIITNLALNVIYYEFDFINSDGTYNNLVNISLYSILLCTLFEMVILTLRELAKMDLQFYQKNIFKIALDRKRITGLCFEIFIILLQPYPFFNNYKFTTSDDYDQITFDFKFNYLLVLFSLLRMYTLFRAHLIKTQYMNTRSNRVCKMYLCKSDYMFALKCMFTDYPNQLIGSAFVISIFIFAFALRVCQRALLNLNIPHNYDFSYFLNAVWLTIITMTTVGYGDYFPRTVLGRIVCIILVVWGIFIMSIMVVVLTNTFQMQQRQLKVLSLIKKLEKKQDLQIASINLINHVFRFKQKRILKATGRTEYTQHERQQYELKYKRLKKEMNSLKKQIDSICEQNDVYQQMARQFQCLDEDLKCLNKNQQKLMDFIHDRIQNKKHRR